MIEPGECLAVGRMFGPCTSDFQCSGGNLCWKVPDVGRMCLPPAKAGLDDETVECAEWRGSLECSEEWDLCYLRCESDSDCKGGTICAEEWGTCVYPIDGALQPEPGHSLGPCLGDDMLCLVDSDTCAVSGVGEGGANICAPEGGIGLYKCEADNDCQAGHVCATDLGFCAWPAG